MSPRTGVEETSPASSGQTASLADSEVLRAEVRRASALDGALGVLFERLVGEVGRSEASRLWLMVFSESDASET